MELINHRKICELLHSEENDSLFIDPILDESQIGQVTVDLRLGYDFMVSILTRKPYIGISKCDENYRSVGSYFQTTRRELGDRFVLYPNQVVLATTLEYVSLPSNVYADVLTRSSYTRLGIHMNTMIQPGFKGCVPIELFNHSNNAIELIVGSRVFQTRLYLMEQGTNYRAEGGPRKYIGNVRPTPSKADADHDIEILDRIITQG